MYDTSKGGSHGLQEWKEKRQEKEVNFWLLPWTLPTFLQGYFLGALSLALGFTKSPRFRKGVLQTTWRPWFAKRWRYSTTLGAFMGLHPNRGQWTEFHEFIHCNQYQDENLKAVILGGICCFWDWRLGLGLWASSGMLWLAPNFITGWVRFGQPYMGSEHEKSAYAQTKCRALR